METRKLNIRIDKVVKKQAEEIFNELGLNMTIVINIFLKIVICEYSVPFELKLDIPNKITASAIDEGRKMVTNSSTPRYTSMADLKKTLEK